MVHAFGAERFGEKARVPRGNLRLVLGKGSLARPDSNEYIISEEQNFTRELATSAGQRRDSARTAVKQKQTMSRPVTTNEFLRSEIGTSESATLCELIDGFSRDDSKPAIVALRRGGEETWSYRQLGDHIGRLAVGLAKAGLRPGDTAALFARNSPEWILSALAVIRAGGVAVPLDAQMSETTLRRVLQDSGAQFVFTTSEEARVLQRACDASGMSVILLDGKCSGASSWQEYLSDESLPLPCPAADDTAILFYTSGTTGSAKGVPLTHRNLVYQVETVIGMNVVTDRDRILMPLPLHHVYPFAVGTLVPLAMGLPMIMPESLTGPQVMRALREGNVTVILGVPRLYSALWSGLNARLQAAPQPLALLFRSCFALSDWLRIHWNLSLGKLLFHPLRRRIAPAVRLMASGGAALDPDLAGKLETLGWQIGIGYGLTETSPLLTLNVPGAFKHGSVGRPISGVEIRIDPAAVPRRAEDDTLASAKPNERPGEVLARGPTVFHGYRNLPEKTAAAFTQDGWFRTGDIGFLDENNYLCLTGRISSLIVTEGGENIQPDEVEEVYGACPLIAEIGVLQKGSGLVAVIVPKLERISAGSVQAIEQKIREAVQTISKRLPSYQRIADFVLSREPIPRTRLGKIRRHLLAQHYEAALAARQGLKLSKEPLPIGEMAPEDRVILENPAARGIWDLLASRYRDRRLTPSSSPQLDLGIDSIEWLNLTLEIQQQSGVELTEEAIGRIETVRDLLREVNEGAAVAQTTSWLANPEAALPENQKRWLAPQSRILRAMAWLLFVLDRVLVNLLFRPRVTGLENLPVGEPFVLTPNHLSYLDPPALAAVLGYHRLRDTYWAGWTGVMTTNVFTRLLSRLARVVPVDPERAILSSLVMGAIVLKRGKNLVWFPEGGIAREGKLLPFRPGIGVLLEKYQTLIVPVVLSGTNEALPPGSMFPRRASIRITFGVPLWSQDLAEKGAGKTASERIVSALYDHMAALQFAEKTLASKP